MPARSRSPSKRVKRSKPKRSKQQKARHASQKQKRNGRISKRNRPTKKSKSGKRSDYRSLKDFFKERGEEAKQKEKDEMIRASRQRLGLDPGNLGETMRNYFIEESLDRSSGTQVPTTQLKTNRL